MREMYLSPIALGPRGDGWVACYNYKGEITETNLDNNDYIFTVVELLKRAHSCELSFEELEAERLRQGAERIERMRRVEERNW